MTLEQRVEEIRKLDDEGIYAMLNAQSEVQLIFDLWDEIQAIQHKLCYFDNRRCRLQENVKKSVEGYYE